MTKKHDIKSILFENSMWLQEILGGSLYAQNGNFQGFLNMVIPHFLCNAKQDIYLKFRKTHECYCLFTCGKYNSSLKKMHFLGSDNFPIVL